VNLGSSSDIQGDEIYKARPCVVISADTIGILSLKVVVPLTTWKDHYSRNPWMFKIEPTSLNGLSNPSAADSLQVRSVSEGRFVERLGVLTAEDVEDVVAGVALVIQAE
jgi:mRNA interferase MazF